jgi:hypothetical protein
VSARGRSEGGEVALSSAEERDTLGELAAAVRHNERLGALAEYAEIRNRWQRNAPLPGDHPRRVALRVILDRTGGIPDELRWPRRKG